MRPARAGRLYTQIIPLHQLVLAEFWGGVLFKGDGAVNDEGLSNHRQRQGSDGERHSPQPWGQIANAQSQYGQAQAASRYQDEQRGFAKEDENGGGIGTQAKDTGVRKFT